MGLKTRINLLPARLNPLIQPSDVESVCGVDGVVGEMAVVGHGIEGGHEPINARGTGKKRRLQRRR